MSGIREGSDFYTQPTFTLRNRIARVGWGIAYTFLFRPSPRTGHKWRAFLLRCFGAKIGTSCRVAATAVIWAPWNLILDDYSVIGDHVICYSMDTIHLGKKSIVSQYSHLCTGSHDYTSSNFQLFTRPIEIGAQAWVCAGSFVGPGVTIGEGAVIGAAAVVTKSMPDWTVCAGNPCKPLKPRIMRENPSTEAGVLSR